jgi:hypothetical protein
MNSLISDDFTASFYSNEVSKALIAANILRIASA